MDKSKAIIFGGIGIFIIGLILFILSGFFVEEQFTSSSILLGGDTLEPSKTISVQTSLDFDKELFLAITGVPQEIPLIVKFDKLDENSLFELAFSGTLFESLGKLEKNEYKLTIINVGENNVSIFAMLTPDNLEESEELFFPILFIGSGGIIAFIIGIIVIVFGIFYWLIQRRKTTK